MAYPSDYRHNPFSDVSTAVQAVERHIIPATSPYVINLNEVPRKDSPSTILVKEITAIVGSTVTYGSTFAEVAANPASGEFWSDYNTGADGDKSWNTGKLLFASSDAGKLVEVSYTATGTLAGVKSNRYPSWWLCRGDGSDGDFCPATDTTISGLKQYRSVFIPAGVTVTISRWAILQCQGSVVVKGTLTANGQGAGGGSANGGVGSNEWAYAAAGGAGGYSGGAGGKLLLAGLNLSNETEYLLQMPQIAAGGGGGGGAGYSGSNGVAGTGGTGGSGGGYICILGREIMISGIVTANGTNGANGTSSNSAFPTGGGGGGGGGGAIAIVGNRISPQGSLTANGGSGGSGKKGNGSNGGAGIIITKELGDM